MKTDDFSYPKHSEFPMLVLGYDVHWRSMDKQKTLTSLDGYKLDNISHQTSGVGCNQHYIIGVRLTPREGVLDKMSDLCKHYYDCNFGMFGKVPLSEVNEYAGRIRESFGFGCNRTYRYLEEALYPIDHSPEALRALAIDDIPDDPRDMVYWGDVSDDYVYWSERIRVDFTIFILGENSD